MTIHFVVCHYTECRGAKDKTNLALNNLIYFYIEKFQLHFVLDHFSKTCL